MRRLSGHHGGDIGPRKDGPQFFGIGQAAYALLEADWQGDQVADKGWVRKGAPRVARQREKVHGRLTREIVRRLVDLGPRAACRPIALVGLIGAEREQQAQDAAGERVEQRHAGPHVAGGDPHEHDARRPKAVEQDEWQHAESDAVRIARGCRLQRGRHFLLPRRLVAREEAIIRRLVFAAERAAFEDELHRRWMGASG